jgi:hypothetical protein
MLTSVKSPTPLCPKCGTTMQIYSTMGTVVVTAICLPCWVAISHVPEKQINQQ